MTRFFYRYDEADYSVSKITTRFKYAFSNKGSVPPIPTLSSWLGFTPSATNASYTACARFSDNVWFASAEPVPLSAKPATLYLKDGLSLITLAINLTLTIPSWASSIDRTRSKADLRIVSDKARGRLAEALTELQDKVSEMLAALKEE